MRNITLLICLHLIIGVNKLDAQFLLIDDMEGHGPASGNWIYNAGTNATGSVIFNAANPGASSLNASTQVAKFTKDTSCSAYMAAAVTLPLALDLSAGATLKCGCIAMLRKM